MPELRTAFRALAWNVIERRAQRRSIEAVALEADMALRRWAQIEAGEGNQATDGQPSRMAATHRAAMDGRSPSPRGPDASSSIFLLLASS